MDQYKETHETWNKIASIYEEKFMYLDLYNESFDLFCIAVNKPNAHILEIGCGPGNITQYLINKSAEYNILATDIAPNMVELAKKNNPTVTTMILDCRDISLVNKKFDAIICGFCIPYISAQETKKLIKDCTALLNPGGTIYLSYVDGDTNQSGFKTISTGDRSYFYYHSTPNILTELKNSGFSQLKSFLINYQKAQNENEMHSIIIGKQ